MKEAPTEQRASQAYATTARILTLLRLFSSGNVLTFREILSHPDLQELYRLQSGEQEARAWQRARKMLGRDLRFLRERGWHIMRSRKTQHYALQRDEEPGPLFLLQKAEVEVLIFLQSLFADPVRALSQSGLQPLPLSAPRHPFAEAILAFVERLAAALPQAQRKYFELWAKHPVVFFNVDTFEQYFEHRETLSFLIEARRARRQIQFQYRSLRRAPGLYQRIDPYAIAYRDGHCYLIAYERDRQKTVEFRIDRIEPGSLTYCGHALADGVHAFRLIEFRFWISADIGLSSRWVSQAIEREEMHVDYHGKISRRLLVRAVAYSRFQILKQMLSYGDQAQLLEPEDLVVEIRETLQRMLQAYGESIAHSG